MEIRLDQQETKNPD